VFGDVTGPFTTGNAVLGIHHGPGNCVFGFKPSGVSGDAVVGLGQTGRGVLGVTAAIDRSHPPDVGPTRRPVRRQVRPTLVLQGRYDLEAVGLSPWKRSAEDEV
jgi:hypothetical protein